eukprot:3500296-Pyramimonas_sp.AAC.1
MQRGNITTCQAQQQSFGLIELSWEATWTPPWQYRAPWAVLRPSGESLDQPWATSSHFDVVCAVLGALLVAISAA